jgi:4,5-DOPA dioxygenase extradiol
MAGKIKTMPVIFFGHGNPMNVIRDNPFTRSLKKTGQKIKDIPKAILMVSAHWLTEDTYVATTSRPETIHDFYGFPPELYRIQYPAPGAPEYAKEVIKLIPEIKGDGQWGLDHGAWSVLKYLFPQANIPVFQLSIYYNSPIQYHFDLARKLRPLRQKGVLIIGSGNIVHNLSLIDEEGEPYDWAIEFDQWAKDKIDQRDFKSLINYEKVGWAARLAVPTVDHYVPLLYCLALADKDEDIIYTYEKIMEASLSMRCLEIG